VELALVLELALVPVLALALVLVPVPAWHTHPITALPPALLTMKPPKFFVPFVHLLLMHSGRIICS